MTFFFSNGYSFEDETLEDAVKQGSGKEKAARPLSDLFIPFHVIIAVN